MSHPRVCREKHACGDGTWTRRSHPLRGVGLNILSDGDPQAGYPAILVLTGDRSRLSVFTLSYLSQARGIAKAIRGLHGARTRTPHRDKVVLYR